MSEPWWLAGGIDPEDCIAAYQPIGAASLEKSYINLAHPDQGTYNAKPGVDPTFDYTTGWKGTGWRETGASYLTCNIVLNRACSAIVRFSNMSDFSGLFGMYPYEFAYEIFMGMTYYKKGSSVYGTTANSSNAVVAITGQLGYLDGKVDVYIPDNRISSEPIYILGQNRGTPDFFTAAYIKAIAFYYITLTEEQVSAITTKMNALTGNSLPASHIPSSGMRRWAKVYSQQQQTFNPAWARNSNRIILPGAMLP